MIVAVERRLQMAAGKRPGPQGLYGATENIDDGTMCRAQSPLPGPLGSGANDSLLRDMHYAPFVGAQDARAAFAQAILLSAAAIDRETGYQLGGVLKDAIPSLLTMLAASDLSASGGGLITLADASIMGAEFGRETGLDAGPDILRWLGVSFLRKGGEGGFGETIAALRVRCQEGLHTAKRRGVGRKLESEVAAEVICIAVGTLVRLLLEGIVAFLNDKRALSTGTVHAIRWHQEFETVDEATVTQLTSKLRASRLGSDFGVWVERNWKTLIDDPRLRIKPSLGARGGVGSRSGEPERERALPTGRKTPDETTTPQESLPSTSAPIGPGINSIVCSRGRLVVQNNNAGPDRACTQAHEESHIKDWKSRYGDDLCKGVPDGSLPVGGDGYGEFLRSSECKAYRVGQDCRKKLLKTAAEKDKAAIQGAIDRDDAQLKKNKCN